MKSVSIWSKNRRSRLAKHEMQAAPMTKSLNLAERKHRADRRRFETLEPLTELLAVTERAGKDGTPLFIPSLLCADED